MPIDELLAVLTMMKLIGWEHVEIPSGIVMHSSSRGIKYLYEPDIQAIVGGLLRAVQ